MDTKKQGLCTVELNAYQEGKKIKLSPVGEFRGVDGRLYVVNQSSVTKTQEAGVDIYLNVEHGFTSTYSSRAVGWIPLASLEMTDGGVFGLLELNDEGKKLIADRSYRYLSPEFVINQKREVISIDGIALTNTPNLKLEINKKKETPMGKETHTDPETTPTPETTKELNEKLTQVQAQLVQKDEAIQQLEAELKEQAFNAALTAGKVTPAQKEFALSLDRAQLNSWLGTLDPAPHATPVDPKDPGKGGDEDDLETFGAQVGWE